MEGGLWLASGAHVAGWLAAATLVLLAGCASGPRGGAGRDGADANPPAGLGQVPDAEPRVEPIRGSGGTSKPYTVLGRSYVPITDDRPFRESGLASWYGRKFHAQSTASGEPYDMYAMTAAHKTLPLPSYVRVRNPANGREVIVRVNDRGPFHDDRVIDLSYTAALKLDLLRGVAPVEIERLTNEDIRTGAWRRGDAPVLAQQAAPAAAVAATDGVAVPAALTAPVVATSRYDAMEVAALPPMTLPAAAPVQQAAPARSPRRSRPRLLGPARRLQPARRRPAIPAAGGARDAAAGRAASMCSARTARTACSPAPMRSRDTARDTAEQVRNGLQLAPVIVERR